MVFQLKFRIFFNDDNTIRELDDIIREYEDDQRKRTFYQRTEFEELEKLQELQSHLNTAILTPRIILHLDQVNQQDSQLNQNDLINFNQVISSTNRIISIWRPWSYNN